MKYTFVKQHDETDCAAACLAMICMHYKKDTTITKLRDLMGTDIKGTNLIGLSKCAEKLGFASKPVKVDASGFRSEFTKPCIANIISKEGLSHFVVIFKVTKRHVIVGDPGKDLVKIAIEEFLSTFTGILMIILPTGEFEQEKQKNSKMFYRFMKLLLPQKKLFIYSILASLIMTVLGLVASQFNRIIMDEIIPYNLEKMLLSVFVIFLIITVTQVVVEFVRGLIMLYLSQRIDIPLMLGYFKHVYSLPVKFFASRKTGDIITRFSDAFTIKEIFTNIALTLVMDISMTIIVGVVLFNINGSLFGIIILVSILSVVLVFAFRPPYKRVNEEQMQQLSIVNSELIESLTGVETIKSVSGEEVVLEGIEKEYIKSLRLTLREGMLSNAQSNLSAIVTAVGSLVIMYFGVKQVINGDTTLGVLMSFMTLSGFFLEPLERLIGLQLDIQEANVSMKRVSEILDSDIEQEEVCASHENELKGNIEFKNITFRYGNRTAALKTFSLKIKKGQKVALIGNSGSGKSSIAKLLLKYYEPEEGSIHIGSANLKEMNNNEVRKGISYVPQSVELFSKSIYDNIKLSKPDSNLEEVIGIAKMVEAHSFVEKLPMGYHTHLEESGKGLSGGERQRLALARAFLKNNEIFVFDEPTSSLDFETENSILNTINTKLSDKTVIMIAHRLSTIKDYDLIVVMGEGRIVEKGSHEELLAEKGMYYKLWKSQQ